jgi:transcriptional regulator with XRE-family HTH domain
MNTNTHAQRLRAIRKSKGWSLQDVELHSNGKWKAVVVGSYERADRAISLKKAISLMQFYQVPITELFPDITTQISAKSISVNLRKLDQSQEQTTLILKRFTSSICNRRKN